MSDFHADVLKALGDDELTPFQLAVRLAGPPPTTGWFLGLRRFLHIPTPAAKVLRALARLEYDGLITSRRDPEVVGRRWYRRAGDTNPR